MVGGQRLSGRHVDAHRSGVLRRQEAGALVEPDVVKGPCPALAFWHLSAGTSQIGQQQPLAVDAALDPIAHRLLGDQLAVSI
jgi:hypothetical protein